MFIPYVLLLSTLYSIRYTVPLYYTQATPCAGHLSGYSKLISTFGQITDQNTPPDRLRNLKGTFVYYQSLHRILLTRTLFSPMCLSSHIGCWGVLILPSELECCRYQLLQFRDNVSLGMHCLLVLSSDCSSNLRLDDDRTTAMVDKVHRVLFKCGVSTPKERGSEPFLTNLKTVGVNP